MDALISSAIEEICVRGPKGITLSSLWPTLTPSPSPSLKSSLWTSLLSVQTLNFSLPGRGEAPLVPHDPRIQRFEDAEALNLRIVANDHLRDCFLGLYDTSSSELPPNQLRALQRIALTRTNGITQSQLAKEFGMEGNNFFYIVKKLEARGLIVRQQAIVKTRETGCNDGEMKNGSCVTTNLIYLYRYAKHLGTQQRFEINKEARTSESLGNDEEADVGGDGFSEESVKDDVLVRDYLPAMKAICDKLEEANTKVLVISDIKRDLGYCRPFGHRDWRKICRKLLAANLVENFEGKVNGKVERCMRLLKKFSQKDFDSKNSGIGDDFNEDRVVKFGRRFQETDQLVELAIDHQIYDMFDAEGMEGELLLEVCRKLGIDRKRNDSRLNSMFTRFGMYKKEETHKRTEAYRVWTSGNCKLETSNSSNSCPDEQKNCLTETKQLTWNVGNLILDVPNRCAENVCPASEVDFATHKEPNKRANEPVLSNCVVEQGETNLVLLCHDDVPQPLDELTGTTSSAELGLDSMVLETNSTSEKNNSAWLHPSVSAICQKSPYPSFTANGALREQRILDRLQDEKFILKAELHRWLTNLEKDKRTTLDRKTIDRILNRLQQKGRCKCKIVNVPGVTYCDRSRQMMVILHPSVQSLHPQLSEEILDRLRSFEKHVRSLGSSRCKIDEPVPVLNDVIRTQSQAASDDRNVKWEAMRANGFVLAKMVRAKLLHCFLWTYLSCSPGWDDSISSGAQMGTYKLFSLEEAKKAIPVELLLQVAGSTKNVDDMIEKCKRGLRLSDLPIEEYRCLMDTQAIGKLSVVVDILRRLKLIRLVHNEHSDGGVKVSLATFTHAMEIKPYIEEPPSVVETSTSRSVDLRPRIRHDFILSNREAVDEYWKTLEYCYAATDPKAALHAFPGSSVPELLRHRSWASARVISAEQRADLLKRFTKDNSKNKISYGECKKIAKELNLSLQQVLSVYYDNHRQRSNGYQGKSNANKELQHSKRKHFSPSKKRKKSVVSSSIKHARNDSASEWPDAGPLKRVQECFDHSVEEQDFLPPEEHGYHFPVHEDDHPGNIYEYKEDDNLENIGEQEPQEGEECCSLIGQSGFSEQNPVHPNRFLWTDEADRKLIMQYARHRASLGARIQRVDWTKILDLPAPPKTCTRRMSSLNKNKIFRKALMKFCTMLSKRYARHLEKVHCTMRQGLEGQLGIAAMNAEEAGFVVGKWDDFEDDSVKAALEDVYRCKQMARLDASKTSVSAPKYLNSKVSLESELVMPGTQDGDVENLDWRKREDCARRSRSHRLHQKFTKILNEGNRVTRQVNNSLAASNAVELLKLVFLSTSAASQLPNLLAQTLRRYSELDLFAAFSYLREKKMMIGGDGNPFVLSQQFLHGITRSPFPANTGKGAAKFSCWLHERENDLMEEGTGLAADLQCGDIFQLFALVSSDELSISPCVPKNGVGEADDLRNMKRKAEVDENCNVDRAKKLKSLADSELISRREKGFPGITVFVHRTTFSTVDALNLFAHGDTSADKLPANTSTGPEEISCSSSLHRRISDIPNFSSVVPVSKWCNVSPWEAMAGYMNCIMLKHSDQSQTSLFDAELFREIYTAIQKAGDQGLSMEEISEVANISGENLFEQIVDVLQAFGQVLKVNAFDSMRIVDALYCSKYFLTPLAGSTQDFKQHSVTGRSDDGYMASHCETRDGSTTSQSEVVRIEHDVHRVTILNCPEAVIPLNLTQHSDSHEGSFQEKADMQGPNADGESQGHPSSENRMAIFPWVNGDGTINKVVYKGLVRRILGTVMLNPGIVEDDIIQQIDVLNPQSCRSLLELMILDNHLIVRKMQQSISSGPPVLLRNILGTNFNEAKPVYREHFFANAMSASLL